MVFGLSKDKQDADNAPADNKKQAANAKSADKTKQNSSSNDDAADEAKKLLEEMQAKEDDGRCAFC